MVSVLNSLLLNFIEIINCKELNMKVLLILCLIFCMVFAQENWYHAHNPVFLDQETIGAKILKQGEVKIITFITPVCRFCEQGKKMIDGIKQKLLQGHRDDVKFYFVDCNEKEQLCYDFSISLVPYVIIFNSFGKVIEEFPGERQPIQITATKIKNAIHVVDIHSYQLQRALKLRNMRQQYIPGEQKIQEKTKIVQQKKLQTDGTSQKNPTDKIKNQTDKLTDKAKQQKTAQKEEIKQKTTPQKKDIQNQLKSKDRQQAKNIPENNPKKQIIIPQNNISAFQEQHTNKIDIKNMLPHESKAKVLDEVLQTRRRRNSMEALKTTSNVGKAIMVIFMIGLALYLKNLISNDKLKAILNKDAEKISRSPQQYDSSLQKAKVSQQ